MDNQLKFLNDLKYSYSYEVVQKKYFPFYFFYFFFFYKPNTVQNARYSYKNTFYSKYLAITIKLLKLNTIFSLHRTCWPDQSISCNVLLGFCLGICSIIAVYFVDTNT